MAVLAFPVPKIEQYQILYNLVTHEVDIPLVPDNVIEATCILYVLFHELMDAGTLSAEEILYIAYQVAKEKE